MVGVGIPGFYQARQSLDAFKNDFIQKRMSYHIGAESIVGNSQDMLGIFTFLRPQFFDIFENCLGKQNQGPVRFQRNAFPDLAINIEIEIAVDVNIKQPPKVCFDNPMRYAAP